MIFHVVTSASRWKCEFLSELDHALVASGSVPVTLDWDSGLSYDDPDHFTTDSSNAFVERLANCTAPLLREVRAVHVVTDSTIDYNDWVDGIHTKHASNRLIAAFARRGVRASVDAVSGSGFVARAREGEHFHQRVSHWIRTGNRNDTALLLMGGWNDVASGHHVTRVRDAAAKVVALVARGM